MSQDIQYNPTSERPCDGCEFERMCSKHEVVCRAFYLYAMLRRWQKAPRIPNTEYYERLYG
jgi:hypothetical protein